MLASYITAVLCATALGAAGCWLPALILVLLAAALAAHAALGATKTRRPMRLP
jgi:hypothetical protein